MKTEQQIRDEISKGWNLYDAIRKDRIIEQKEEKKELKADECGCGGHIIQSNGDYFCGKCGLVVDAVVDQGQTKDRIITTIGTIEKKRGATIIYVQNEPVRYEYNGRVVVWCERMVFDMTKRQWNKLRAKKTKTAEKVKILVDRTRRGEGYMAKEEMAFLCGVSMRTLERYIRDNMYHLDRLIYSSSNTPVYEGKRAFYRGGSGKVDYRRTDGGGTLAAMRDWWYGRVRTPEQDTDPAIFDNAFECAFFPVPQY